jgi:hypothetical protein
MCIKNQHNGFNYTSVLNSSPAKQRSITYSGLKPTKRTNFIHHPKRCTILTSDIFSLYFILFDFTLFYTLILQTILTNNHMSFNTVE